MNARRSRIFLCPPDPDGAAAVTDRTGPECPNGAEHTPSPLGYLEWHAWAERMAKTHYQVRCTGCGLWTNWLPKTPKAEGGGTSR